MIDRNLKNDILLLLEEYPAVAILGPRQVGKTTLAHDIGKTLTGQPVYLDLESPSDLAKLSDPEAFFELNAGQLVILDEIQRVPELFAVLRGVIDRRRRDGYRTGQFLILGSASLELIRQSSESLAGRLAFKELSGLTVTEVHGSVEDDVTALWLRGGFPDSMLATSDDASMRWRLNFILTYLERDIPQLGPRIPATTLRRLWTMLAHQQGGQPNYARLGSSLEVAGVTAKRYVELFEDLLLIRSLRPWSSNVGKRLVKAPKVYIRDSGISHALLGLKTIDDVLGHPVSGPSWEGFVVENILSVLPQGYSTWYYRTAAGAEIDLVIEAGSRGIIAIEIKRSSAPVVSRGYHVACDDIGANERCVIHGGNQSFPMGNGVMARSLIDAMRWLIEM